MAVHTREEVNKHGSGGVRNAATTAGVHCLFFLTPFRCLLLCSLPLAEKGIFKMLFVSLFVRLLPSILPNYRNDFSQRWQSVFFFCVGVKIDVNISKGFAT